MKKLICIPDMEHWHAVLLLLLTQGVDCSSCLVVYVDADLVDFGDFGSVVDVDYYGDDVADSDDGVVDVANADVVVDA